MTPIFTPDERELIMRTRVALNTAAMRAEIVANNSFCCGGINVIESALLDTTVNRIQAAQNALEELV